MYKLFQAGGEKSYFTISEEGPSQGKAFHSPFFFFFLFFLRESKSFHWNREEIIST